MLNVYYLLVMKLFIDDLVLCTELMCLCILSSTLFEEVIDCTRSFLQ